MYCEIVADLDERELPVWDDGYLGHALAEDVCARRLHVLFEGGRLVSAVALDDELTLTEPPFEMRL